MEQSLIAIFTLIVSFADVPAAKALVATKDTRLTIETAAQHVAAARFAAVLTAIDPDLLLAIAHHESRFDPTVVGRLVRGKRACGVMQQVPVTAPCPEPAILRDYVNGARHLARWIRAQRGSIERGLIGYAGGYALLELCDRGKAPRACSIARYHLAHARRLKRSRAHLRVPS